ncbi:MAG: DUF1343 domain-containing protein [Ignavibacteriaceae bacterium]|nr:DUF1343 domain-containing protein [Ignavibacteriaceae bacterium]
MLKYLFIFILIVFSTKAQQKNSNNYFLSGAEVLIEKHLHSIENKRIGVVCNHSSLLSNSVHLVDWLSANKKIKITALFTPEHGIGGSYAAGEKVNDSVDLKSGIPIFSLYGKNIKPTKTMLQDIDIIIFDIQDVGARFYTYISTLYYVLQAAAENDIPVVVLDRPNLINGDKIEGPLLEEELLSFVGVAKIPIRYGMTIGELAYLFVGENLIHTTMQTDLTVIKLENWEREKYYDEYSNLFIPPSPNIPDIETAIAYSGNCLIEGTNISEGRGTDYPFLVIGAPFIDNKLLLNDLNFKLSGAKLEDYEFIPKTIEGKAINPKYENQVCKGLKLTITDRESFVPLKFTLELISSLIKLYPEKFKFNETAFDKLAGTESIRKMLLMKIPADEIIKAGSRILISF